MQSPPANTPFQLVLYWEFTETFPYLFSSLLDVIRSSKGVCPAALIIISQSMVKVSPVSTGLLLPEASGSPNLILLQTKDFTFPFSEIISFGAARYSRLQPSNFAISSSTSVQGFSFSVRL